MKMSKFRLLTLTVLVVMVCAIGFVAVDAYKLKTQLDEHSGGIGGMIRYAERLLHQKLVLLTVLVVATGVVISVLILSSVVSKRRGIKKKKSLPATLVVSGLMLSLVIFPVSAQSLERWWAGISVRPVDVSFAGVIGGITPLYDFIMAEEVDRAWVCHHIAAAIPETWEWLEAGYLVEGAGRGSAEFYIGWELNGEYHEIRKKEGFQYGKNYGVFVGRVAFEPPNLIWKAEIFDEEEIYLSKLLPLENFEKPFVSQLNAESETPSTVNAMSAKFFDLVWAAGLNGEFISDLFVESEHVSFDVYHYDPYTIVVDQPYFAFTVPALYKPYRTCPTLFWNSDHELTFPILYDPYRNSTMFVRRDCVEEGVLDIHAESDITVEHEIQNIVLENGVYKLQLRELDNYTSHIDQVRLYAIDDEGEWYSCPLTYAYHNELGKVKHTLRFDDDSRVDLKPTEIISLRFAQPECEPVYFIFEINGYNKKWPGE